MTVVSAGVSGVMGPMMVIKYGSRFFVSLDLVFNQNLTKTTLLTIVQPPPCILSSNTTNTISQE